MRTLILLRHGTAAWNNPKQEDFDRPLTEDGRRDAYKVGEYLQKKNLIPDLFLSSTAQRTKETLECVMDAMQSVLMPDHHVSHERGLYLCGAGNLFEAIRNLPERCDTVMIVAHNPDIHSICMNMDDGADYQLSNALKQDGYPTGTLTQLECPVTNWNEIELGMNKLAAYLPPGRI